MQRGIGMLKRGAAADRGILHLPIMVNIPTNAVFSA